MRHISHDTTPPPSLNAAFREYPCPDNPAAAWRTFDSTELRERLWELQHGLCAYCERVLEVEPGGSSIEHIKPKTVNPRLTFQYTNLVLCCTDPSTCNLYKKGKYFAGADITGRWRQGFIDPTQARCEFSFDYKRDGSVEPMTTAAQDDACETIDILNLNETTLKTDRREYLERIETAIDSMSAQLDAVQAYLKGELSLGALKPYYSAKRQHFSL